MAFTAGGALRRSALAVRIGTLRADGRRLLASAALTLTGLWRSAAFVLDGLFEGLARDWAVRTPPPIVPPAGALLRLVDWLPPAAAAGARAVSRLTSAHLRLAVRLDGWLMRFAA